MFAAAKKGKVLGATFSDKRGFEYWKRPKKTFFKKDPESIAGKEKGFYICTRLARKRAKLRKKEVHRHIGLTA